MAVGASAGGLEALEDLFRDMDPSLPAAFLVQQHMPADAESRMDELLQRITRLTVRTASDGANVQAGQVLVAPPSHELGLHAGRVRLTARDPTQTVAHPIDHLFRAIASDREAAAIGIVLSGTGNDGARGSREIRAGGGTVLVQDPASARFDAMPNAAIAAGAVDHVLLPEQMGAAVAALLERRVSAPGTSGNGTLDPALGSVLFQLRAGFGVDFAHYKPTTVRRRVGRRMSLRAVPSLPAYVDLLRGDPQELASLYHDLLIGVTQFFRDEQAFELLGREAIDGLLAELKSDEELRAWVPGCATGEEAYSIAMLLDERRRDLDRRNTIRVFATDLHSASVHTASVGLYPPGALAELGEARRVRYFRPQGNGWMRVAQHLREMVVFATHDLLGDAPFTRLHLLSCRNLLVYLQPAAQRRVLGHFHVALRDRGVLFLGPYETPGPLEAEFEPIARTWKIYRKRRDVGARLQRRPGSRGSGPRRWASGPHPTVAALATPALAMPTAPDTSVIGSIDAAQLSRDYVGTLEAELRFTQANLQATIEELETSNEELKASNEELAAANEEMQSTNEELHSLNEELFALDTEHRRKIEELGELTDDLDNLLQGIDVGVLFLDRELRVRRFTSRLAATFRLQPQDIGRPLGDIASEIDGIAVIDDAIRVLERGQPREREVIDRTGVHRLLRVMPYRSSEHAQGVVITLVDISSLRHAQADVQRLSAIVEHTQDAVISQTLGGAIVSWNDAAARLYGWSSAEAIGRDITFIIPPELHAGMRAILQSLANGERIDEMETQRLRKDGAVVDVSATISPVRAKNGGIIGASSITRDITRRKAAEAQVRLAVEQRERFLATLSHELRNPVMAISSAAEVLRDQAMAEPWALRAAEVVLRQKDHMAHLLEDLLDVSRIRENKIEMHCEVFDLRHTVDDATSDLESRVDAAGLRLVRHGGEQPAFVLGDRTRLRQVVANLLTNAIKFSPPSTQVDLVLDRTDGEVALHIRDHGIGLDDETRARIFEPFFQGRPGDGRGLGLGLALVAAIVEAHDGRIDVTSDGVGHGCEFTVVLPLSDPPERVELPDAAPLARPSPPPRRLLIVEDQPDNRMLLEFLLSSRGYDVTAAGSVAEAIACLRSRPLDVAIVDIGLPDGPGHDVARAARTIAAEDQLLLVALTGHGQPGDRAAAKEAGFQHHLVKPVEVDVLVRLIEDHHAVEVDARRMDATVPLEG